MEPYRKEGVELAQVVAFGKKAWEAVRKAGWSDAQDCGALLDHPAYAPAAKVAAELMQKFVDGEVDRVELIYHHFRSSASQVITQETLLPISIDATATGEAAEEKHGGKKLDFIVEPSKEQIVLQLIPKALYLKLYTALLDSLASEHAARVIAMQIATDNADELLRELTLTYNKTRQQAITTELLDIVGGSMQ